MLPMNASAEPGFDFARNVVYSALTLAVRSAELEDLYYATAATRHVLRLGTVGATALPIAVHLLEVLIPVEDAPLHEALTALAHSLPPIAARRGTPDEWAEVLQDVGNLADVAARRRASDLSLHLSALVSAVKETKRSRGRARNHLSLVITPAARADSTLRCGSGAETKS